ncbi:hypothetical protein C2S53_003120 [Perilla frutescens var. hirtella]|uniref:Uncharacterized protein n=1 Tax=Perilla frutescens var. hirtella TaxID=608512 RepID=A0AAD4JM77_PERFH|nr:hypothetical protein C2S53_003120 [Perilla frutescens var. hirtella]
MEATRNRGRGKIFSCFRPVVLVHDDVDDDEPISDYSASLQSSGDEGGARRKRKLRRSFSAALKAVVFRTTLLKKSRSENHHGQDYDGFRSHILSRGRSFVRSLKKNMSRKSFLEPDDFFWSKNTNRSPIFSSNSSSRTPSLASSSSSGSSRSSPTRSEPDTNIQRSISLDHFRQIVPTNKPPRTMKKESGKKCGYTIPTLEVCVLLVCLFALIWGKVFAIVACTSAWLFLSPNHPSQKLSYEVFDSEEYKKRVIMGGLLERDRCRFPPY